MGGERQPACTGLDCAEAELDVIYTQPTSGSSGRRRNHYLAPESCPSHVAASVGFHIKMDPLLLQHPTFASAPASHQRLISTLSYTEGVLQIRKGEKRRREMMTGKNKK